MQSFQTFLLESFDKPARWKWSSQKNTFAEAGFKVGKKKYFVIFEQDNKVWEVHFGIYFSPGAKPKNSMIIISTVLDVIEDFIQSYDPDEMKFTADKPGEGKFGSDDLDRPKLYRKVLKSKLPKEYKFTEKNDNDMVIFHIKKTG